MRAEGNTLAIRRLFDQGIFNAYGTKNLPTRFDVAKPIADPLPMSSLPEDTLAALALIEIIQPIKGACGYFRANVLLCHGGQHPATGHAPWLADVEL